MAAEDREGPAHDAPSGLPEAVPDDAPLGPPHARPEGEGEPERGAGAMPGIPDDGSEPPSSG